MQIEVLRNTIPILKYSSNETINIIIKKKEYWPYVLFFHALKDEVEIYSNFSHSKRLIKNITTHEKVTSSEFVFWVRERFLEGSELTKDLSNLLEVDLQVALKEAVSNSSFQEIILTSKSLGLIYKYFLDILYRVKDLDVSSNHKALLKLLSENFEHITREFKDYPNKSLISIENALENLGKVPKALNLKLDLKKENDGFFRELERVYNEDSEADNSQKLVPDKKEHLLRLTKEYGNLINLFKNMDNDDILSEISIEDFQLDSSLEFIFSKNIRDLFLANELFNFQHEEKINAQPFEDYQLICSLSDQKVKKIKNLFSKIKKSFIDPQDELKMQLKVLIRYVSIASARTASKYDEQTIYFLSSFLDYFDYASGYDFTKTLFNELNAENKASRRKMDELLINKRKVASSVENSIVNSEGFLEI